jgi:drug/metabolite transporter (DMT)-like permease
MKWALVATIVAATTLSDALLSRRMKAHGEIRDFRPGALGRALAAATRHWHVAAAVALMAVSFFAFLSLLSMADLSFAVPATAVIFVVETLVARLVLGERVSARRWLGTALVTCGVVLIAL